MANDRGQYGAPSIGHFRGGPSNGHYRGAPSIGHWQGDPIIGRHPSDGGSSPLFWIVAIGSVALWTRYQSKQIDKFEQTTGKKSQGFFESTREDASRLASATRAGVKGFTRDFRETTLGPRRAVKEGG